MQTLDCLDLLAIAYMRGHAAPQTEITSVEVDGANAKIRWLQRDVEIYGFGRGDNSGTLDVPLCVLVSQPADALSPMVSA